MQPNSQRHRGYQQNRRISVMLSCFTGFPFCSLLCQTLLGKLLFFCLFSAVKLFLALGFLLDSGKRCTLIRRPGNWESRQGQYPVPGSKPLLYKSTADDFSRPGGMLFPNSPGSQISNQLFIRILCMLLTKICFLLFQCFLDHPANGCFIYILSSGICHDFFLSKQKLRQ